MKILFLDIETAPNLVYCWNLWNQNIAVNQIVKSAYVLCWAAKWADKKKMEFSSCYKDKPDEMIKKIHALLDEADVVVHYNGSSFDIPRLNQEFKRLGMNPPSPFKEIDLFRVVARKFDLPSRKLEYVVQYFGLGEKVKHAGMELWTGCLNEDPESWRQMEVYNKGDVKLLEKLYDHLLPWIENHPNRGLHEGHSLACTNCGSQKVQSRGVEITLTQVYQRYQCRACGKWMRARKTSKPKDLEVLRG